MSDLITNAELRIEAERLCDENDDLRAELKGAQEENAKLRELVRIAIEYCVNGYCAEEDECPLYESRTSCKLYAKARELGIEAGE
jgi:hypothetical protein